MSKEKSKNYPGLTLESAISIVTAARALGKSIAKSTLSAIGRADAKGSIKSGAFLRKLAALSQYGFIEIEGDNIKFTDTAEAIIYPTGNNAQKDKEKSIIKAFLTPSTFYDLYNQLEKNLPISIHLIRNKSIREIGITPNGVNNFIRSFIDSGIFAKLIEYSSDSKQEIRLLDQESYEHTESASLTPITASKNENSKNQNPFDVFETYFGKSQKIEEQTQTATLLLSNGKATIQVPKNITEKDKHRLKAQIDVFISEGE